MKNLFTLLFIGLSMSSFGQKESSTNCSKRDRFLNNNAKSNSLTEAQIIESENYDVHFYSLDVAMDNLSTDISGTGEIHGTARVAMDSALFELFGTFTISEIRVDGNPVAYSRVGSAIKVPVNVIEGFNFEIAIDYNGTPPTAATNPLGGAGMTNASSGAWGNQVSWSLSEPFSAYEWWPCKQSLRDKADSCSIKVTVPNSCKAGSNGVLENVVDLGNGTSRYEWMHRHAIDYYLISIAVAEYVEYNVFANPAGAPGPVLIQNFIYDNPATLPFFQNDIDETVDFMELFADLYGPYPFQDEKYGHCMAPLSGGMEHQTMTTQGFFNKGLTSHELGHQWWGDNVTCESWADIWVNEGFASYSEYLMLESLYPSETTSHMFDVHDNVMSQNGGSTWVLDSLNEGRIFSGRLTYDKGAAIVHTFRYIMNNDVQFFDALRQFQTTFTDSTAYGVDVRDVFENVSGVDYTEAFNQWYFGAGFPIYSARWNMVGNDLLLEVSHTTSSTTPLFTNPIDLKLTRIGSDTTIRVDITGNTNQFIFPNIGNVVNIPVIDPDNWVINETGTITHDLNFLAAVNEIAPAYYSIYPNPSNGEFNISVIESDLQNVVVLDPRGRVVHSGSFSNNYTLDLSHVDAGYYIVQLTNSKGDKRIKTIIKD